MDRNTTLYFCLKFISCPWDIRWPFNAGHFAFHFLIPILIDFIPFLTSLPLKKIKCSPKHVGHQLVLQLVLPPLLLHSSVHWVHSTFILSVFTKLIAPLQNKHCWHEIKAFFCAVFLLLTKINKKWSLDTEGKIQSASTFGFWKKKSFLSFLVVIHGTS